MKPGDKSSESSTSGPVARHQAADTVPAEPLAGERRSVEGDEAAQSKTPDQIRQPSFLSAQDKIATPVPFTEKPTAFPGDPPARASRSLRLVVGICLFISLLSLALSGFLFFNLLKVRQTFSEGLDTAIQAIDSFEGEGFRYEYRLERTVPISASIPIEQDLVFPFSGDIPINTTVRVPIDAGILGTFDLDIPINTTVAVDTAVPVKVDQRFEVSTTLPVSMTIPIAVQADDPAIQGFLSQVRRWLIQLRESY